MFRKIRNYFIKSRRKSCASNVIFGKISMLTGCDCITIEEGTTFGDFLYLTAWPKYRDQVMTLKPCLEIGKNCHFGDYLHITCANKLTVGDGCLTGKWVTISDNNHGTTDYEDLQKEPLERNLHSKGPVIIGRNVWIGDKVTILSGVEIGDGVVIAANSVVTKSIPSYSVVAGIPAKIIENPNISE